MPHRHVHALAPAKRTPNSRGLRRSAAWIGAVGASVAGLAVLNAVLARRAERKHPAPGKFVEVDGTRLHYLTKGDGEVLILLHGNGSMVEDFETSGLLDEAAKRYRVIAFDRPGFGHSPRPRDSVWSPQAQADLIALALDKMGVERAVFFGHSWGTLVALALAVRAPGKVDGLILASGYYFPVLRVDAMAASLSAVPVLGTLMRYTVQPLLSRLFWRAAVNRLFSPASVPAAFARFPESMALRPTQLRSMAEESAMMSPAAALLSKHYANLQIPVWIIAGAGDRIVAPAQSKKLHREMSGSNLSEVGGAGHMVHHSSLSAVAAAINAAASH